MQDVIGFWDGEKWTGDMRPAKLAGVRFLRPGYIALAVFVVMAVVALVVGYASIVTSG